MRNYKIYLAGPISGCSFKGATDWRKAVCQEFAQLSHEGKQLVGVSPMRAKEYLSHLENIDKTGNRQYGILSGGKAIVARDRNDVLTCDAVLMNLSGADKVSIGTMIEVGWADAFRKPIVLVLEKDNPHVHDMVTEIAGFRVGTLEDGIHIINALMP